MKDRQCEYWMWLCVCLHV